MGQLGRGSVTGRVVNLAGGLARLAVGSGRVIVGSALAVSGKREAFVASFYTLCRGAGLVAKVFGRDYKEYAVSTYR